MPAKPEQEPTEKRTHRHALPLSDGAVALIRRTAEYTGIGFMEIKEKIAASRKLMELVEDGCDAVVDGYERERERRKAELLGKKPAPGKAE